MPSSLTSAYLANRAGGYDDYLSWRGGGYDAAGVYILESFDMEPERQLLGGLWEGLGAKTAPRRF